LINKFISVTLHVWGRGEVHTEFWWGDLRGGDHFEELDVDARIILKQIFK